MKLYVVGIGPGYINYLVPKAREIILDSDVIVGYNTYIELIEELIIGKEIIQNGMKNEVERCKVAVAEAKKGKKVTVISSGDAGIYGMASLLYEITEPYPNIKIEVISGITAATASASILGAPLANDFAVISLSDLLTPWEVIEKRLIAVAGGDMVVCLYNPMSHKRNDYLEKACNILLKVKAPQTHCGYVKNAFRDNSSHAICTLEELVKANVDMFTTVIIGNTSTKIINSKLVTTRGYRL